MKKLVFVLILAFTMVLTGCECGCGVEGSVVEVEPSDVMTIKVNTEFGWRKIHRYTCDINGELWYVYYVQDHGIAQLERVNTANSRTQDKTEDTSVLQQEHYFDF